MASGGRGNPQRKAESALKCTGRPERTPFQSQPIPGAVARGKDPDNLKLSEQEAGDGGID